MIAKLSLEPKLPGNNFKKKPLTHHEMQHLDRVIPPLPSWERHTVYITDMNAETGCLQVISIYEAVGWGLYRGWQMLCLKQTDLQREIKKKGTGKEKTKGWKKYTVLLCLHSGCAQGNNNSMWICVITSHLLSISVKQHFV